MTDKLKEFLTRNHACAEGLDRLATTGVETLEQAWKQASDEDLIWIVTRPGVMSQEQKRLFLVMVLSSIEDKLTDMRSLNILKKLRTNETITDEDREAAAEAESAAACAEESAAAWRAAASAASAAEAWAAMAAAEAAMAAAEEADAAAAAVSAAQAKWVRENFKPSDLNIK